MKSLKEALLNRPKNVDVAGMAADAAEEYIKANYNHSGELTFENLKSLEGAPKRVKRIDCDERLK